MKHIKLFEELFEGDLKIHDIQKYVDLPSYRIGFSPVSDAAVKKYKQNLYFFEDLNKNLRNGTKLDDAQKVVRNGLEDAISINKLKHDIIVYRIVDMEDYPMPKKDGIISNLGFISTSADKTYLEENIENYEEPLIITLKIPSGTPFLKFKNDFESEILFGKEHSIKYLDDCEEPDDFEEYAKINAILI